MKIVYYVFISILSSLVLKSWELFGCFHAKSALNDLQLCPAHSNILVILKKKNDENGTNVADIKECNIINYNYCFILNKLYFRWECFGL